MTASPERLTAAVIGCGAIAHEHLRYLGNSPRVRLAAVCDRSPATAEFVRDWFGAEAAFTDHLEMLNVVRPQVVHVLTPPQTHPAIVRDTMARGADVICEKPLAPDADETARLLDEAAALGRTLLESRNLLFNDAVLALDERIAAGALGDVREVDVLLSLDLAAGPFGDENLCGPGVALPGGAVHDFLPHLVYLFEHFATPGSIDRVTGVLRNVSGNARVGYDHLDALLIGASCRGRLRIASDLKPDAFRLIVRGTKASAETDFYSPFLREEGGRNVGKRAPLEQIVSGWRLACAGFRNFRNKVGDHTTYHGMPRMLDRVYCDLSEGRQPFAAPASLRAVAQLIDRIVALGDER